MENKYMLSVIVPFHNTPSDTLATIAASIGIQQVITDKIELIFIEDGPSRIDGVLTTFKLEDFIASKELLSRSSLYTLPENVGPGLARQMGLNKANGRYVMFCDADDVLYSSVILHLMVSAIDDEGADYLSTNWVEETGPGNYILHEQEISWVHGKMFRRSFLEKHGIQFHPELRVHEDTYFSSIAIDMTDNPRHLPEISYIWKYNKDSITRADNELSYEVRHMPLFVKANCDAIKFLYSHHKYSEMTDKAYTLMHFIYLLQYVDRWQTDKNLAQLPSVMESLYDNLSLDTIEYIRDLSTDKKENLIDTGYTTAGVDPNMHDLSIDVFDRWVVDVYTKILEREASKCIKNHHRSLSQRLS